MISEEDKVRYLEAQSCKDCMGWHKHCKAECCKIIFLNIDPKILEKDSRTITISPSKPLKVGERKYYEWRDVEVLRGMLRFRKDRIKVINNRVIYFHPCRMLDGFLCKVHGTDSKPDICKEFTLETVGDEKSRAELTDNCLFRYKCKEVEDAKKETD